MTWRTQLGERRAVGQEAELIRDVIGYMHDVVVEEIGDLADRWHYGVPIFDNLEPVPKLSLLADVGEALLNDTPPPPLTALNEGTVAAIFCAVRQLIAIEIDDHKDDTIPDDDRCFFYRTLVLEIATSDDDHRDAGGADGTRDDSLPTVESTDMSDWECLIEAISDRILWDEDYLYADELLDADPEMARRERKRLGIVRDYCLDMPPDPDDSEVARIRERLHKIARSQGK
jgi:hypothetical protein